MAMKISKNRKIQVSQLSYRVLTYWITKSWRKTTSPGSSSQPAVLLAQTKF